MTEDPQTAQIETRESRRRRNVAAAALALGAAAMLIFLVVIARRAHETATAESFTARSRAPGPLPRLWRAPDFSLLDQHRRRMTLASFHGRPFIADFIFTECTSACPMMTSKLTMLERRLAGRAVHFVSFSVDPAHDTPAVLAAYAATWNADDDRWSLFATTPSTLRELVNGFRVTALPTGNPESPIIHSVVFFLVDGEGFVRRVYDSMDTDAMDALASDAEAIAEPVARTDESRGSRYASLGCGGCHDNPKLAPPLFKLHGSTRLLENGKSIVIDDDYLRSSILEPGRDRVDGYSIAMPSYRAQLSDAEVAALVAELDTRTSSGTGIEPADVHVVIDPVCGMKVRTEASAPHVESEGKDVYFCSETCREAFLKDPMRFRADAAP